MIKEINNLIRNNSGNIDTDLISDGWHTFGELYEHRSCLFIALAKTLALNNNYKIYKSKKHTDGSMMEDYFNLCIKLPDDGYIAYHLNIKNWKSCDFAIELEVSPVEEYNSDIALENIRKI